MRRKTLYLGLVVLALVALVGCAKPPQELVNSVQAAIDGVKQAGAEMYAPDALAKVTDLFSQAQAEIETQNGKFALFRSYKKAEEILKQAQAAAETAKQEAIAAKEKAKQEATAMIESAKTKWQAATDALAAAPVGKDTKAEIEAMKSELTALEGAVKEAENAMGTEDYLNAKAKAESVAMKADQISSDIAQAMEKVKGKKR
jgi:hypothetical protein